MGESSDSNSYKNRATLQFNCISIEVANKIATCIYSLIIAVCYMELRLSIFTFHAISVGAFNMFTIKSIVFSLAQSQLFKSIEINRKMIIYKYQKVASISLFIWKSQYFHVWPFPRSIGSLVNSLSTLSTYVWCSQLQWLIATFNAFMCMPEYNNNNILDCLSSWLSSLLLLLLLLVGVGWKLKFVEWADSALQLFVLCSFGAVNNS